MTKSSRQTPPSRVSIIQTVQTPLGFFTLVVLVVEVILGLTASFSAGMDRTYLVVGMIALIFLFVLIVAAFAGWNPNALQASRSVSEQARGQARRPGGEADGAAVHGIKILWPSDDTKVPETPFSFDITGSYREDIAPGSIAVFVRHEENFWPVMV